MREFRRAAVPSSLATSGSAPEPDAIEDLDIYRETGGRYRGLARELLDDQIEERFDRDLEARVGAPLPCGQELLGEN